MSTYAAAAIVDAGGTALTLSGQLGRARPAATPAPVEIVLAVDGVRSAFDRLRARDVRFLSEPHNVDGTNDVANGAS